MTRKFADFDAADLWISSHARRVGAYLFALSLVVALLYLTSYAAAPFFSVDRLDALYNRLMATKMRDGTLPAAPFFRAPGYASFLAAVFSVLGDGPWGPRLVQALIGAGSVVLCYRLGAKLVRPSVGALAGVFLSLHGPLVYNNGELHTPPLEVFLGLAFLNALLAPGESARANLRGALIAGAALGLSIVVRPNAILWLALGFVWLLARTPRKIVPAVVFLAVALIPASLVTLRNARAGGDPVFVASQGGINLFLGNRLEADGFTPSTPTRYRFDSEYEDSVELYGKRAADEIAGRTLSPSESSRFWTAKALDFWTKSPGAATALSAKKTLLLLGRREVRNNTDFQYIREKWAPILWLAPLDFGFCVALGLPGIFLLWRRNPAARFLAVCAGVYAVGIVAFFVADRYRLPLVPILLIFSAATIVEVGERLARRQTRSLAPTLALIVVGVLVSWPTWIVTATPRTRALDDWSAGNRLVALRRPDDALAFYRDALKNDPENAEIWSGLGEANYYLGRFPAAAAAFSESIRRDPNRPAGYLNLAMTALQLGKPADARALLTEALRRDPTYTKARVELAALDKK